MNRLSIVLTVALINANIITPAALAQSPQSSERRRPTQNDISALPLATQKEKSRRATSPDFDSNKLPARLPRENLEDGISSQRPTAREVANLPRVSVSRQSRDATNVGLPPMPPSLSLRTEVMQEGKIKRDFVRNSQIPQ
jgi:hypothetical protein